MPVLLVDIKKIGSEEGLIRKMKKDVESINDACIDIANKSTNYMKTYIKGHHKRDGGTGTLEEAVETKTYKYSGKLTTGVSINKSSPASKYWEVVNYGGYTPPAERGFFGDGNRPDPSLKGQGTEQFHPSKRWKYMTPGPIRPMHFIESTANWLSSRWAMYWKSKTLKK